MSSDSDLTLPVHVTVVDPDPEADSDRDLVVSSVDVDDAGVWVYVKDVTGRALAIDVLALAQVGGIPDTYWATDSRIARACEVLGVKPAEAMTTDWTEEVAGG